jgi:hypothetical protein
MCFAKDFLFRLRSDSGIRKCGLLVRCWKKECMFFVFVEERKRFLVPSEGRFRDMCVHGLLARCCRKEVCFCCRGQTCYMCFTKGFSCPV